MHMQVNQAGTDHLAARIQFLGDDPGGNLLPSILAHDGDFPVEHQHIGGGIELVGGVNHTATGDEERFHAARRLAADELTGQARSVESRRIAGVAQW